MIADPIGTAATTVRDIEAARIALVDENDADAGRLCRRVLELTPNDPEAMAILGVVMARSEHDVTSGIGFLEEASESLLATA